MYSECSEYMGISMKTQILNGINWFAVWPVNIVCCIVFCNFWSKTTTWNLLCVILARLVTLTYWAWAFPSSPPNFKGPCSGTLYSSHLPCASEQWTKLDFLHISASLSSYYFLNTAGTVFSYIPSLWDTATISQIRTLIMTQYHEDSWVNCALSFCVWVCLFALCGHAVCVCACVHACVCLDNPGPVDRAASGEKEEEEGCVWRPNGSWFPQAVVPGV